MRQIAALVLGSFAMPAASLSGADFIRYLEGDLGDQKFLIGYVGGVHNALRSYGAAGRCINFPDRVDVQQIRDMAEAFIRENPDVQTFSVHLTIEHVSGKAWGHRPLNEAKFCM